MVEYMRAGGVIMWIIALLSFIALTVVLERLFLLVRSRTDPGRLEAALSAALRSGDSASARDIADASDSSLLVFSGRSCRTGVYRTRR